MKQLTYTLFSDEKYVGGLEKSTISSDLVTAVTDALNEDIEDGNPYSEEQVRIALFICLCDRVEAFLQDEIYEWFFSRKRSEQDKWLGAPERNLKQEQLEEFADRKHDEMQEKHGG